jgi:endo-1,4-beta-mannosidase
MPRFVLGVNYWPSRSAMYMWKRFDLGEIREDMAHIRSLGLDLVRFFLLWEDFAPDADRLDASALRNFGAVIEAVAENGLRAIPTLFCGHMSGVNWLPAWTLDKATPHGRFRTIAGGATLPYGIGDFYRDPALLAAQTRLARVIGERAHGSPALYLWDLGNEFSNLREPETPDDAAAWSKLLTNVLSEASGSGTTAGIHGEDFERDRHIRPSTLAKPFDAATMHGYSVYSNFSRGRLDANVVPFLCRLVQSFAGKPVLFSEFGNPQCAPQNASHFGVECLTEEEMTQYAEAVLERLLACGAVGAMWWCWSDYALSLAELPPFDLAPHELRFGMIRADGTEKPVAQALARFAGKGQEVRETPPPIIDEEHYFASLPQGVFEIYREYCESNP